MRFSIEVGLLIEILTSKLQAIEKKKHSNVEDEINRKILGLIFSMMNKVWKKYDQYLFPYLKQTKLATVMEE